MTSLRDMLLWAIRAVPYYRDMMKTRIDESTIRSAPMRALEAFPILTKAIIRREFEALKCVDLASRKWELNTSGGSTGEPARFVQDRDFRDASLAITHLYHERLGHGLGSREVHIWGSDRDIRSGTLGARARVVGWWLNTRFLNAFRMTPEDMHRFVADLNTGPPSFVVAYATAAYELARYISRKGLRLRPQKALVCTAGTLHDFMRRTIEDVYQCPVYNRYGSREVSAIACERPDLSGLWLAPWGNYVEIVDDSNQPLESCETGNIIITCLTNRAMPLIRYAIGDRGAWDSENRGRVLAKVVGRTVDAFRTRTGTIVDGEYFTHLLYFMDWVDRFQIVQSDYDSIVARIVARHPPRDLDIDKITVGVREVMGRTCQVRFEFLDHIADPPSGKYRYTMSEVQE
jgi:phenylacetate-CoA ligase